MATEQKKTKTAKSSNSRRRGSARNSKANGSNSRTPSRKINATQQATAPQQDAVLIAPPKYRKGSMRYIKNRLDKVDALVLTHGHEDHIGGVPYLLKLRPDIPLIGSKLTLAFVDAKCKEHRQNPTKVEVSGRDKLKVGPFDLEFVNVTHSIPDALAVYVKTPAGSLIDTGDIKLDQLPLDHRITDLVEFGKIGEKGVDLLMMDSTNAEVPGFVKPETSIGPALDQAFAQATRKIIVASFSSHVHRVQQVVDAAHKYGRKVVFVGRSMVRRRGPEAGQRHSGRQARLHVHRLPR